MLLARRLRPPPSVRRAVFRAPAAVHDAAGGGQPSPLDAVAVHGRRPFWQPPEGQAPKLADNEEVVAWMANDALVDHSAVWGLRRMEMWLALRVLRGLDLEEFLEGSAHAYGVVSRLMYRRQWDKLEPLVSPDCLDAMQFTMEQFGDAGQRIEGIDADDAIRVRSNLLCRAQVMKEAGDEGLSSEAPRMAHLDVSFVVDEKFAIYDFNTNEPVGGFDGETRQQKSTWRFEGAVSANDEGEWRLHAII